MPEKQSKFLSCTLFLPLRQIHINKILLYEELIFSQIFDTSISNNTRYIILQNILPVCTGICKNLREFSQKHLQRDTSFSPCLCFNPLPCPSVSPPATLFRHQTTITITTVKLDVPLYPVRVTATSIFSARASPIYSILTLCVPFSPRLPPKISPRTTITITNSTLPNEASLSLRGNASSIFSLQPHSPTNSLLSTKHGGTCWSSGCSPPTPLPPFNNSQFANDTRTRV